MPRPSCCRAPSHPATWIRESSSFSTVNFHLSGAPACESRLRPASECCSSPSLFRLSGAGTIQWPRDVSPAPVPPRLGPLISPWSLEQTLSLLPRAWHHPPVSSHPFVRPPIFPLSIAAIPTKPNSTSPAVSLKSEGPVPVLSDADPSSVRLFFPLSISSQSLVQNF